MRMKFAVLSALLLFVVPEQAHGATRPDKVAYVYKGDIYTRELPGGESRRLTQGGQDSRPQWSPDGRWMTFERNDKLWVVSFDGSRIVETPPWAARDSCCWQPGGHGLVYTDRNNILLFNPGKEKGSDPD